LSESSDSSDNEEPDNDKQKFEKLMEISEVPVVKSAALLNLKKKARKALIGMNSNSSDSEYESSESESPESPIKKSTKKKEIAETTTNHVFKKPLIPPASNLQLVKNAFDKNRDFNKSVNEFVKVYKEKEKILTKIPLPMPKIIPAPQEDPSKRVAKKKKKVPSPESQHPNAHLGGIFTINNGWDKNDITVEKEKEMPKVMVPRELRSLPPVAIVTQDQNLSDEMDDLDRIYGNNQISFDEVEEEEVDWYLNKADDSNRDFVDDSKNEQGESEELVINEDMPSSPTVDNNDDSSTSSEGQVVPMKSDNRLDLNNNFHEDDDEISIGDDYA
jgi:hypothetical protein